MVATLYEGLKTHVWLNSALFLIQLTDYVLQLLRKNWLYRTYFNQIIKMQPSGRGLIDCFFSIAFIKMNGKNQTQVYWLEEKTSIAWLNKTSRFLDVATEAV